MENGEVRNTLIKICGALMKKKGARIAVYLALGALALLICLSGGGASCSLTREKKQADEKAAETGAFGSDATERKLEQILSKMDGAGRVKVMLTYANAHESGEEGNVRGVIVLAEGGANFAVKNSIIAAVSTVLGIEEKCVEVFVMSG